MNLVKKLEEIFIKIFKENFDLEIKDLQISEPPEKKYGLLCISTFSLAKILRKNPQEIAKNLENILNEKYGDVFENVNVLQAYVNFDLNKDFITKSFLENFENLKQENIFPNLGENKKIIVDYIGPNIGKKLHIGHICTPLVGQFVINIHKKLGFATIGDTHVGDWGIIFGKLIYMHKNYGNEKDLQENPIEYLNKLYLKSSELLEEKTEIDEEFRKEFKLLSSGDENSAKLWYEFCSYSLEELFKFLEKIDVNPDISIGESFYEGLNLPKLGNYPDLKYSMKDITKELLEKNIATKNEDGSVGLIFAEELKMPSTILQKRDETFGYLASDIACIKYRIENWNPEKIVYCVDERQSMHFKQAFQTSKNAGWIQKTELIHLGNGTIGLKDGAMSSRKGNVISLEDLFSHTEKLTKEILNEKLPDLKLEELEELAKIIGIGALKYSYYSKHFSNNIIFDFDEFLNFEGNSGPYLQYAYVRSQKILEKVDLEEFKDLEIEESFQLKEEIALAIEIMNFEKNILESFENFSSAILCNYLYELSRKFSAFYAKERVLEEENLQKKVLKIKLLQSFAKIMEESFEILGIKLPKNM